MERKTVGTNRWRVEKIR